MSHAINYAVYERNVSRKAVLAEIQEEVMHEDWQEGGWYPDSQLKWHEDHVFETREALSDTFQAKMISTPLTSERRPIGRSSKPMISMISLTGSKPIFNFSLCIRASSKMRVPFSYSQAWYYGTMVY